LCETRQPVARIFVDTYSTASLAFNTVYGYSQIDFRRPDNGKLRELAAILDLHVDFGRSQRLYTGLYLDMLWTVEPALEITFKKDGVILNSGAPRPAPQASDVSAPPRASAGSLLSRALGSGRRLRQSSLQRSASPEGQRAAAAAITRVTANHGEPGGGLTLVAFGDSNVFGSEISEVELGRVDDEYRAARAFPRLMARELGMAFGANLAEPGRSNPKIFRTIVDFVRGHRDDLHKYFLVIAITHPGRKGFFLKSGREYMFVDRISGMHPWVMWPLCMELFYPAETDVRMNQEIEHKYWVLCCFLRKLGARFVVTPAWEFGGSGEFFRDKDLGKEGAFFFDAERIKFGIHGVVAHLPRGPSHHPLSQGHALFSRELATLVRARGLA
jgi:hypothetical protein